MANSDYKQKYIKYKEKYCLLKNTLNMTGGGDQTGGADQSDYNILKYDRALSAIEESVRKIQLQLGDHIIDAIQDHISVNETTIAHHETDIAALFVGVNELILNTQSNTQSNQVDDLHPITRNSEM